MGMGFENSKVGFGKKNELGNGIDTPLQEPLQKMLHAGCAWIQDKISIPKQPCNVQTVYSIDTDEFSTLFL